MRFPGQYYDAESGLNYNYFRDYDSATGRYVESDPIGLRGGLNTYSYVGGKPQMAIDPRGLVRWQGTMSSAGAAVYVGASLYRISVKSDCVKGKRGRAEIVAVGPTIGAEIKGAPPISATTQDVTLDDRLDYVNPGIFNGWFSQYNIGFALGWGYGCSAMQVGGNGGALAPPIDSGAISIGCGSQSGLDASISGTGGTATVVESAIEDCGCEEK